VTDDVSAGADVTALTGGPASIGTTVWQRATSTAYVESPPGAAQRVVVLDLDHLDLPPYVFEGSAAQVWACLDGLRTEAEIVADLAEAFAAPVDEVGRDIRGFVDRLADLGLIVAELSP
jgi:pyrroloquinoline quinone biosynthesis protein D